MRDTRHEHSTVTEHYVNSFIRQSYKSERERSDSFYILIKIGVYYLKDNYHKYCSGGGKHVSSLVRIQYKRERPGKLYLAIKILRVYYIRDISHKY